MSQTNQPTSQQTCVMKIPPDGGKMCRYIRSAKRCATTQSQQTLCHDTISASVVPRHNLSKYESRAFAVAGPAAWNSLSDDLGDPAL